MPLNWTRANDLAAANFLRLFFAGLFLVACKRLYRTLCRSVGPSVGPSVRRSVGPFTSIFKVIFFQISRQNDFIIIIKGYINSYFKPTRLIKVCPSVGLSVTSILKVKFLKKF